MLCCAYNDLRYPADYLSAGLLLSALAWFAALERAGPRAAGFAAAMAAAAALSVAFHLVVGFHLY
jgi:hypothetical protein